MHPEQTYANHRRFDPIYHFVTAGLYAAAAILAFLAIKQGVSLDSLWMAFVSVGLLIHFLKTREYPLRAQDRVIRLEELLRMERLLPQDLKSRTGELKTSQFVALRFASDGELADRVREALDSQLSNSAIKQRIKIWRPDTYRV